MDGCKALVCGAQQNLGAALRAAYFLGAAGVLCCDRHSAPLSPAVSKARSWHVCCHLSVQWNVFQGGAEAYLVRCEP